MLKQDINLVWLGPWFQHESIFGWRAASPAALKWQKNFFSALQNNGIDANFIYFRPDPYWPKGRLLPWLIPQKKSDFDRNFVEISYLNVPIFRHVSLSLGFSKNILAMNFANGSSSPVIISYNSPSWVRASITRLRRMVDFKWVCIVADGVAPDDADGYVFLSYGYFQRAPFKNKIHLDGGAYPKNTDGQDDKICNVKKKKIFVYSGGFGSWAGVDIIFSSLEFLKRDDFLFVLTGPYPEKVHLEKISADERIKYLGFLEEDKLSDVYRSADYFINPRPRNVEHNENNFPSKLLDYMTWKKPVLSTWTSGLDPAYAENLNIFEPSGQSLAKLISQLLDSPSSAILPTTRPKSWHSSAEELINFILKIK
ncbi:glycosyltransferase [Rhodobacterales bacterium FZCC0069]|nr:glycosyltransferase [Rhodobacterales bacterium FZCC0069]